MRASTPTMWIYEHGTPQEYRGIMDTARDTAVKMKGPLRIAHYTLSLMGYTGEMELARKGVLVMSDVTDVSPRVLQKVLEHWVEMKQRPTLIIIMGKKATKKHKDALERILLHFADLAEKR